MEDLDNEERILHLEGYVQALHDLITAFTEALPIQIEAADLLKQYADALHESANVREDIYDHVEVNIQFRDDDDDYKGDLQ